MWLNRVQIQKGDNRTAAGWCTNEFQWAEKKEWILTYCCRNVSVGRVIGIHIGRVMGGREHSVVVDSECWTKTTEREKQWFIPIETDKEETRWRDKTMGGTWCAGMRRSDAELGEEVHTSYSMSIPDPSTTLSKKLNAWWRSNSLSASTSRL